MKNNLPKRIKYKGQIYEAVGISQGWGSTLSPEQFDIIHLSDLLDKIYGDPRLYRIAYATQAQRDRGIIYSIAYKKDGVWKTAPIKQEDIDNGLKRWADIYGPTK